MLCHLIYKWDIVIFDFKEEASNLFAIVFLFRKYHYKHLPVGVSKSPDIFNNIINNLFQGFECICALCHEENCNSLSMNVQESNFEYISKSISF